MKKIAFALAAAALATSVLAADPATVTGTTGLPTATTGNVLKNLVVGDVVPEGSQITIPSGSSLTLKFGNCSIQYGPGGASQAVTGDCSKVIAGLQFTPAAAGGGILTASTAGYTVAALVGAAALVQVNKKNNTTGPSAQ